METNRSKIL